jgi:hypothetical protein
VALPDETRAAIAAAIEQRAGTVSCRGLAAEFEVSPSTVRKIAKEIGQPGAFARAQTKNATRARVADLAARRAGLAETMLDLAERIAARATEPYKIVLATKDDVHTVLLDEPPLGEVRQAMTAVGIAVDKHMALIRFDTKDGASGVALSLVDALVGAFGVHPDVEHDVDDGYPVPLPTPDEQAAAASELSQAAAAADEATS